ncbi:glycosyltransferase family 2 protein [Formosa maritima]|uniref:Glycosyltransferase n=1 Tax=Formosa maritima TaxID=2592046 RepID=A0A5D0G2G6_9FLAO|nr:glycosyltransferase [Formosa maritima]TYA53068.1 glycosyltransferase [Formosa maritima]
MMILIFCITFCYLLLIGSFIYGFNKIPNFICQVETEKIKFSVVIPFRNEAENLPVLLNSILKLRYPVANFEILFINDASEDPSEEIIKKKLENTNINFKIIQNKRISNSPKKDAISRAIELASYEWIITTDADCLLPKYWLTCYSNFIHKTNCNLIAAPVTYYNINSFLDIFQTLDFLSLIGATVGGFGLKKPFICNGANLAYKKDVFKILNGFEGNNDIASGDDVFLLQKAIKKHPKSVLFLKAKKAIVLTKSQPNFKSLISQRVRWASKTTHYKNSFGKLTGFVVLLMNTALVSSILLTLFNAFSFKYLLITFTIKIIIDYMLLFKTTSFFNQKYLLKSYLISSIFYPFFSVYIVIISLFPNYKWKNRRYRK